MCCISNYLPPLAEEGQTVGSPERTAFSWLHTWLILWVWVTVLNSPTRLQFPGGDLMARTQPEYLCLHAMHAGESHQLNLASAPLQRSDSWGSSPEEILLASPLCWSSRRAAEHLFLRGFTSPSSEVYHGNWRVSAVAKSNKSLNFTPAHLPYGSRTPVQIAQDSLSFANMMNTEEYGHHVYGITHSRQYLIIKKGCPFLLEIKKKLLMLQAANPHPSIKSQWWS